jgi:hypothetical protein
MNNLNSFITLREAGQKSGYHPDYLSSLIRDGKLQGQKLGKTWVTTEIEIKRLNTSQERQTIRLFIARHLLRIGRIAFVFLALSVELALLVAAYHIGYERSPPIYRR